MMVMRGCKGLQALVLVLWLVVKDVRGELLTPPYFNLAEGKNITASATCGVDTEGPELYCKLIGANSENDLSVNVIQGQYCDVCDPNNPDKMHPPEFAVDGMETWWQSPPISRGIKYNEVNLTIDLGQEFHVAYVYIKMANSPRPGLWVLEKSSDYGKTYTPWQYFSDSPADCETFFGRESLQSITRDDSVICSTEYSKIVPLEGGEIPISLLNKRPSASHYFNSTVLQEWTRATNVRLRFLRTKNLLGHLMSVARQDPTVTRRYFYSIKDISIGGRCMCNGHADACDIPDPRDSKVLLCRCKHNTCGAKCDTCCPGFEQKAWRQSKHNDPFRCESCNCFLHSNECVYDKEVDRQHLSLDIHGKYEGGGVCQNCRHNTEGINCNKCKPKFFRSYEKQWNETDVCKPCQCGNFYSTGNCAEGSGRCECRKEFTPPNCDTCSFGYYDYPNCKPCECYLNGTRNLQCSLTDGQCTCLPNFGGKYCKECAPGFYNFSECTHCGCDQQGSLSSSCDQESGNCSCKNNYSGPKCSECRNGYFSYPECNYCNCDTSGTEDGICDKETGQCICKEGYGGDRCDICVLGYYGYPDCKPCNCSKVGSRGSTCDTTGKCSCLENYAGRTCEQCSPGFYNYPECKPCNCNYGAIGVSCDQEGKCQCRVNFDGQHCDMCKEGYYNFPNCEDCNCHPAGVIAGFAGCGSVPAGELCQCKERVEGRICNKCKPLYWNLNRNNPDGCEECNCNKTGVLGGIDVCDTEDGQCVCKPSVIARGCSECEDGTYNMREENLFGCTECGCDVGGSINNICHKTTGQCPCQARVTGLTCKEPLQTHYFPTLYQYQYEVEDGHTPENSRARYAHSEEIFPNYSWKGYAVFSPLQKEVVQDIYISKPSLYRMVLKFVNTNPQTIIGGIRIIPENPNDNEQFTKVQFRNTSEPSFVTVSGESGNTPKPFVMNPGRWSVSINVNGSVLVDFFVLLPEDFYLATILNKKIEKPCTIDEKDVCRHYAYPNITMFDKAWGVGGFIQSGKKIDQLHEFYQGREHLNKLQLYNRVPLLNSNQPDIRFNISVHKSGPYVIVVNYVTPLDDLRTHDVNVVAHLWNGTQNGNLRMYSCPYTSNCRQVIINEKGGVAVYSVNGSFIVIDLTSNNANVAIHSIYAIPYEEWSLDYIKPKPVCIHKDEKCIAFSFRNPPESKKIQFEQDVEGELGKNRPSIIKENNETSYVWLNPAETFIDLRGKVPQPGYYTFVVHYYQPDYPDFDVNVTIQNGQFYESTVPVRHCPSESGCRSVVVQANRNNKFSLTENFVITLKQPDNKNVYLDYLLVIPADVYTYQILEEEELDRTGEFISTCGNNHFNIDTSHEGFCRDSVFSITANHNTGALPCQCDFYGSYSFECAKFGGQCQCKDNIIGRKCEACKTGYYGFPDCKPCNCPSTAYCEPSSGQCICPPHVVGERCDQCEPYTYGYDPIIGCEDCKCNILGVNQTRQCDILSGECPCKENIIGRTCDQCEPGHYSFPYCDSCECDIRGTTAEICDQVSAECFCKKHVVGPKCSFCREGSFNLRDENEEGCTECFCFGKTTRCASSQLFKVALIEMKDWEVVTVGTDGPLNVTSLNLTVQNVDENAIGADFSYLNVSEGTAYFSAPPDYLGKKLTSYGGFLNYTIYYVIGDKGSVVIGPDVVLQGANLYLTYLGYEQPPSATEFVRMLQLVESNFELPSGGPAKREHIMEVLRDLRGIYIKATYWTASLTTRLINAALDEAIEPEETYRDDYTPPLAVSVEQCHCPPNYQGLSCEECAPGYYRISSGPHGGYCVPCQCNGHAKECDVDTGVCFNCTDSTRGDHCELCNVGYHGNALAGTPNDCLICACPLPIASNNFATACDLSADGEKISCECREGYIGARCHSCAPGYFGRPEVAGDYCKPCQCSGNINPHDPSSCDTVTGDCLRCLNNTFGEACRLCAPGFFGDAVKLKDCQACICDELGTDHCNSYTGQCVCKPNVIGEKCDRCAVEHYGFQSGHGCVPCECAEASDSTQCDDVTGQCKCKPGVTGRSCDRCASGYWNYTPEGCASCGCKSEYSLGFGCNAQTGQCECLQGVIGEKCDQCPRRWAFVPDFGCHQCDSCHHALLDDTDNLAVLIDPVVIEFNVTGSIYYTRQKLENMKKQLENLKPKFDEIDPRQINLNETVQELETLEQDSKNLNRKSNFSLENSDSLRNRSTKLKDKLEILLYEIGQVDENTIQVIEEIDKITGELNEEAGSEIDKAVQEGETLLESIKSLNLTKREEEADKELTKVNEILNSVTDYKNPVNDLQGQVDVIKDALKDFNDKLDDLYNHTQYSLNMAEEAENIIARSGKDRLKSKLENIESEISKSETNLKDSERILANASELIEISVGKLKNLQLAPDTLEANNIYFNGQLENNKLEIDKIQNSKPEVQDHANDLSNRVQQLEHILSESQIGSEDAVKAARAYKDIVAAVHSAREAADSAENDTSNALEILNNVQERTHDAETNSSKALDDAHESNESTHENLEPKLTLAISKYKPVRAAHEKNEELLKDLKKLLLQIQINDLGTAFKNAADNAEKASVTVAVIDDLVNSTFAELPNETKQAQSLPKEIDNIKRNFTLTEKQINTVNEKLPPVIESLNELPEIQARHKRISDSIQNNIKKLNQQIELARDIANRIKVGVKFYPNTTLELKNPKNLEDLNTSTKFSGYFKTDKPNGLLLYLGNPVGTNLSKTKSDDYMALIVQNGYPVLKLDIGNGAEQVTSNKYVSDNKWYQFIVERVGLNAKLTIREELGDRKENSTVTEKLLSGPYTIFNLDKDKSKVFVGSFPPQNYEMQKRIDYNAFEGEVEDLVIGNTPVSLWNFNHSYETHGAVERDELVDLAPSTGYRFNGNGYVILDATSLRLRQRSSIQLMFKTFASKGLLFLAGKEKMFISLEIRNGKVLYQYNLGESTKKWVTTKDYNDGKWHKVTASRDGANGRFEVDDEDVIDRTNPIMGSSLDSIETISFGGYPRRHNYADVTQDKFDGCINNVTIIEPIDLHTNIKEYGVTPGCPTKFASTVSFAENAHGYVGWDHLSVDNDLQVSLKFKTKEKDGLIFYIEDADRDSRISLALRNGHLVVISQGIELTSKEMFNDSSYHVVSVLHKDKLQMYTDDYGLVSTDSPPSLYMLYANMYIGGIPRKVQAKPNYAGSLKSFHGCIVDLTVNGKIKNFANTTDRNSEILDKCILDVPQDVDHSVPAVTHRNLPSYTTASPQEVTENVKATAKTVRGDGGIDYVPVTKPPTPPPSVKRCSLPVNPSQENETSVGFRFGVTDENYGSRATTLKTSRLEYNSARGKYKDEFDFKFKFKSDELEGILFYVSDRTHSHYAAVYLTEGHVVYKLQGNGKPLTIKSQFAYNDGNWHLVEFSRKGSSGKLVVDGNDIGHGNIPQKNVVINVRVPFYIGGIRAEDYNQVQLNLNTTGYFKGCIHNITMNNRPMENETQVGVIPCSDNVEVGTFFAGGNNTYVKLRERFKVGQIFNIKMDIKPRVDTGVLVAAHGKKDYYVLELVEGVLRLTVENGKGPITAIFRPANNRYYLCDGQWHNIQAVKSKHVVTLSVDNMFSEPKIGPPFSTSTDTGSALFLGGHRYIKKVRGITSRQPFIGCIKNVAINNEPTPIESAMAEGNINIGYCPTN